MLRVVIAIGGFILFCKFIVPLLLIVYAFILDMLMNVLKFLKDHPWIIALLIVALIVLCWIF